MKGLLAGSVAWVALLGGAADAQARSGGRVTVAPYIEVGQALNADLNSGDAVTFSQLGAGVDVSADTAHANAQLSYQYQRRFSWDRDIGDDDSHTGLARVSARVLPALTLEAGAIATRTRSDIRGAAPGLLLGDARNVAQLYSVQGGPSVSTRIGAATLNANYRVGYTKAETPYGGSVSGEPRRDYYDDSLGQVVTASLGVAPGQVAPFGVTASGGYQRDDASQLHQRYEDAYARGDVLLPVSANVAVAGGVGYEKLVSSQRDPLVSAAGVPVTDSRGRFVTDPASPRRIAYRTEGLYYDVGVVWRPNRRTSASAYVGRRYGTTSYRGQLSWAASQTMGVGINVYDSVETFGHQLRDNVSNLPTSFITARDLYSQQFNGCVFGSSGSTPGSCLNRVLQSITTATYRTRGVDAVLSATRGLNSFGVGAGYVNRKLYQRQPVGGVSLYGLEDESWYAQLFFSRRLSAASQVDANAFVNYYDPAEPSAQGVWSYGATGSYSHSFGHLGATATAGLYSFKVGDLDSDLTAQVLLAARYTF